MEQKVEVDKEGFCVVSRKKGKKRGIVPPKGEICHHSIFSMKSEVDAASLTAKVKQCVDDLQISRFYCEFKESWHSYVSSRFPPHNVSDEGSIRGTSLEGKEHAFKCNVHSREEHNTCTRSPKQTDCDKNGAAIFAEAELGVKERQAFATARTLSATQQHSTDLIMKENANLCKMKQSNKPFENVKRGEGEKHASEGLENIGMSEETSRASNTPPDRRVQHIVCYGLGNFSSCVTARYQLALLILLNSLLSPESCFLFDPNFIDVEKQVLEDLGYCLINENEEGKRQSLESTLFFMPHCGKPLYNNLLWANWGQRLSNLIILGNSFDNFSDRFTAKQLQEEVPYIHKIIPYHREVPVRNGFRYTDIFNDMALQFFPLDLLTTAPSTLWMDKPEPSYEHICDVEIITASSLS